MNNLGPINKWARLKPPKPGSTWIRKISTGSVSSIGKRERERDRWKREKFEGRGREIIGWEKERDSSSPFHEESPSPLILSSPNGKSKNIISLSIPLKSPLKIHLILLLTLFSIELGFFLFLWSGSSLTCLRQLGLKIGTYSLSQALAKPGYALTHPDPAHEHPYPFCCLCE